MTICTHMTPDHLRLTLDWAASEGWNPGLEDAEAFLAADPEGFFVALDGGAPVATISVVNHTADFAFLGLYICHPDYRGKGIGLDLWTHALDHAGTRTVGLDGVPAQQDNYRKSGFVNTGKTVRFSGTLPKNTGSARPVDGADLPALITMEGAASGVTKPAYLGPWFTNTPTRQTLACGPVGAPTGALTLRQCRDGYKIGPLIAPDMTVARDLLQSAAQITGDQPVSIDVPITSPDLAEHCTALGLAPSFETARMYRGPAPTPGQGVFAVTTLELG
jgi:GNAT superfamily N-acetyltransferase